MRMHAHKYTCLAGWRTIVGQAVSHGRKLEAVQNRVGSESKRNSSTTPTFNENRSRHKSSRFSMGF